MNTKEIEQLAKAYQEQIDRRIAKIHKQQKERTAWANTHDHIVRNPNTTSLKVLQMMQEKLGKDFLKDLVRHEAAGRVVDFDQSIEASINDLRMMIVPK